MENSFAKFLISDPKKIQQKLGQSALELSKVPNFHKILAGPMFE